MAKAQEAQMSRFSLTSDNVDSTIAAAQKFAPIAATVAESVRRLSEDVKTARDAGVRVDLTIVNDELSARIWQELQ